RPGRRPPMEEAFLAAIAAAPDDDTPRLVFADWVDDNSQPEWAEFIRLQCRLAALPTDDPQRPALQEREVECFRSRAPRWLGRAGLTLLFGAEFDPEVDELMGPLWEGEVDAFEFRRGWLHSLCLVWMEGEPAVWRRTLREGFAVPALRLLHTFESWYIGQDENWPPPASPVDGPLLGVLDGAPLPALRVLKIGGPERHDYIQGVPRQTAAALPGLLEGLPGLAELHLNAHQVEYPAVFDPR